MQNLKKTMRNCLILFLLTVTSVVAQINPESAPGGSDTSTLNPESDPGSTNDGDPSGTLNPESDPNSTTGGDPVAPINHYVWCLGLVALGFGIYKLDTTIKKQYLKTEIN